MIQFLNTLNMWRFYDTVIYMYLLVYIVNVYVFVNSGNHYILVIMHVYQRSSNVAIMHTYIRINYSNRFLFYIFRMLSQYVHMHFYIFFNSTKTCPNT